jgi:glucose 1-dehydrogenase
MALRLKNKTALITGGGRGIGASIALGFAAEGADILINEMPGADYTEELAAQIRDMGRQCKVYYADISSVEQIKNMFAKIRTDFGKLDVLVNNAAITGWSDFFDTSEELFDKVMNTNIKGTLFSSIEAARIMKDHGKGSIINVSTICAALSVKNLITYSTSKGGIHAMAEQMAVELAPYNIRVNTFGPGPINVERNLREDPNYRTNWGRMVPMGRTGEPEEMVGPALFLASDESAYVTGQLFFVDGGWSVQGKIPEDSMNNQLKNSEK